MTSELVRDLAQVQWLIRETAERGVNRQELLALIFAILDEPGLPRHVRLILLTDLAEQLKGGWRELA